MNKIFNINLGGYPFTIDDDAYHTLDKYLATIKRHFSRSEGCDDIITDIEARIAELFNQELKGQPIVGMREVDRVIKVMGTPEEFGAEEDTTIHENAKKKAKTNGSQGDNISPILASQTEANIAEGDILVYMGKAVLTAEEAA